MTTDQYRRQDDATRRLINEALDQTVFVEAGAGTGKTRALVDRIVAHVLAGTTIDKIAAITFTEKAAAELRDRVRSALEQALDNAQHSGAVAAALDSLDRAQISTIHAFAQALLRTFAADAGVDPDFEVQDAVLTERRMQERWRMYLESLHDDTDAVAAVDRVLSLGLSTRDIERLATELAARPDLADLLQARPLVAAEPLAPDVELPLRRLEALIARADSTDTLVVRVSALVEVVRTLQRLTGRDSDATLAASAGAFTSSLNIGRAGSWRSTADRDQAREDAAYIAEVFAEHLRERRSAALAALMPYIVRFVQEEEVARGREGTLTFDDLIIRTRDVLRDRPAAVRAFRDRFKTLLIDEFQDTDPLQMEIALGFARYPDSGEFESGRLFLVGDPKQSIYRFRRADMQMYSQTREGIEAAGAGSPQLALNQRSRPEILEWVNGVFRSLIGDGDTPAIQPPYHPIHPNRDESLGGPGVAWMGGETQVNARDMRREEARAIAAQCCEIVKGWEVQERDASVRAATYADIAILIPRRILLSSLERSLAAARVPYRIEGGSLIYRTQEVRDIINCLTAIEDPADEVAIVGALRSTAFACSDVDLASFVNEKGRFNYLRAGLDERAGPVADGLRAIREYHLARHDSSLVGLVEKLVWERGIVEAGTLDQGDRNSFRRARFMIEQARSFEKSAPESVRAFVSWLERQAGRMIVDHEGAGSDDDEDAVRIMTIHGAKGLEFPIVILAGLSAAPSDSRNQPVYLADYASGDVGVRTGASGGNRLFLLGDYDQLSSQEQLHSVAEMDRLLYVGATRARDHLVVSLHHTKRATNCGAKRLIAHGATRHANELRAPEVVTVSPERPLAGLAVDIPTTTLEAFTAERQALMTAAVTRRFTSATAMRDRKEQTKDETEPWARGRGSTRVGRAVHATIQSLSLQPDDQTIAAFARAQAVAEAVPHRTADVERLVRWVVRESEAWGRARGAPRAMREVPFAVAGDGTVLEGFVDLLIETPEGIELVDWKTDQIDAGEMSERLERYALQAGLYVYGVQQATGRAVTRVTYVFASARTEASPGEPGALAEAALIALGAA
ncbi:MAG: UvrD-helicase domain-containing protein [Dehalococcoidia bacterium]